MRACQPSLNRSISCFVLSCVSSQPLQTYIGSALTPNVQAPTAAAADTPANPLTTTPAGAGVVTPLNLPTTTSTPNNSSTSSSSYVSPIHQYQSSTSSTLSSLLSTDTTTPTPTTLFASPFTQGTSHHTISY